MSKLLKSIFVLLALVFSVSGQNFQLHYETHQDRQFPNAIFESYTTDNWGATYWFGTLEFTDPFDSGDKSLSSAYLEIARYLNFGLIDPLQLTVQYNDGVAFWGSMGKVWLTGVSYPLPLNKIIAQIDVMARIPQGGKGLDAQLTAVWFYPIGAEKLSFVGYLDVWSETEADDSMGVVMLSEPQFWYKTWENLDLGVGAELSYNFPVFNPEEFKFYPNLSLRWNF